MQICGLFKPVKSTLKKMVFNICKPTALGVILVPGEFEFQTGERLCRQMRGQMNVISDEYNQKFLWEQNLKSKICSNLVCEYIPFS